LVKEEWVAILNGDMILYPNAIEDSLSYIKPRMDDSISCFSLGLYNPFLEVVDNQFCVVRSSVYKSIKAKDSIIFDRIVGRQVKKHGYRYKKRMSLICGTHFEDPSLYQVFTRFLRLPQKYSVRQIDENMERLKNLLNKTRNSLYQVALDAISVGIKKKDYPGSYRVEFDNKSFEDFDASRG
jgi:hypothetical protein